jgi:protein required for attachment to host cells
VLVANAARAGCFVRDPDNNAMKELCSFAHPASRLKGMDLDADRGGKVRKSAASTQFSPHTDARDKEHAAFAHELAAHLEDAARAHRYPRVAVIASKEFLGELRARLGTSTQRLLGASVGLDLTICKGVELEQRVAQALQSDTSRAP